MKPEDGGGISKVKSYTIDSKFPVPRLHDVRLFLTARI